jgi:acetyl esterase/lipase
MFIFATSDDKHGNSALVMAGALRDYKVPVTLHFLPSGGHGYGLRTGNPAGERWPLLAKKWLKETVK